MAMKNKKVTTNEQIIYADCYKIAPSAPPEFLDTTTYQNYASHTDAIDLSNEPPKHDLMPDSKNHQSHLEGIYCEPISPSCNAPPIEETIEYQRKLHLQQKSERKRKTVFAGVLGGTAGLLVLGPVAGVALGAGCAIITKRNLKRKENILCSTSSSP